MSTCPPGKVILLAVASPSLSQAECLVWRVVKQQHTLAESTSRRAAEC